MLELKGMPRRKIRVIIDTNLWISFLLTKDFSRLDRLFSDGSILLLFSQELLDEFIEVAQRPKLKKYFSNEELDFLILQIRLRAEFVAVVSKIEASRDKKDNFLLSLAIDGKAHYLLTGDKDLLVLNKLNKTKIMSIAHFIGLYPKK